MQRTGAKVNKHDTRETVSGVYNGCMVNEEVELL